MASAGTELFVYGTLRHDQPEHARYCRGVSGWQPAQVRGRLFRLVEGYLLLVVPPGAILGRATDDAAADEGRRRALAPEAVMDAVRALDEAGGSWVSGELIAFEDAAVAWPPLDRWEGVSAGRDSVYARVVMPVRTDDPVRPWNVAWVYVATRAPTGAVPVGGTPVV